MRWKIAARALSAGLLAFTAIAMMVNPAGADSYVPISGAGSTWSFNAIDQWRNDVEQFGMRINYASTGSSEGRRQFLNGTVDFAASDIPFQFHPEDGSPAEKPEAGSYAYMPVTAGGTVFMYNLTINGQQVTNLRLSGTNIAKIFTGVITNWDDPAIAADNPQLTLPSKKVVPVVRSDGSGSTAQFSLWFINQQNAIWTDYCHRTGRSACGETSYYPGPAAGMISAKGDDGVAGYVSQKYADGAVGYVNYSYAINSGFPVVKMLNGAGYYTEPTPENVAVSLLKAEINTDPNSEAYLTQKLDNVYSDSDPRTYALSSYSYMILPTKVQGRFDETKGKTLGAFSYYAMCQGQQSSSRNGYSPMPINLVQAGFDQIKKIPGVVVQNINIQSCNNPTFSPDGHNTLADRAPMPEACDKQGPAQCATGTGGARKRSTALKSVSPKVGGSTALGRTGPAAKKAGGALAGAGTSASVLGQQVTADGQALCSAGDTACTGGSPSSDAPSGSAIAAPITLAASSGWTSNQTLMVLAALLALVLILAPGVTARLLASKDRG